VVGWLSEKPARVGFILLGAWILNRVLRTLIQRYGRTKVRDRTGLWVLAAQPPFLALVMAVVFPKPTSSMLFMLSLSCLWFGMSGAVRELIAGILPKGPRPRRGRRPDPGSAAETGGATRRRSLHR